MKHAPAMNAWMLLSCAALGACSDAPSGQSERSLVPAYQGPGSSAPAPANANAGNPAPASSSSSNPGSEGTQVNQLAPSAAGVAGNGSASGMPTPGTDTPGTEAQPMPNPNEPAPVAAVGASPGCGSSAGVPQNPGVPNTILSFPPAYDGSTPFPLLFAFHGANRTNGDMRRVDSRTEGSELEANYVVAFVKSTGNAWDLGADYPRFEAVLDQILGEHCIDTGSLFAMGHSSGAQFIVQMLGDDRARETRLAAVAPVSSSLFQNPAWAAVPTLLIHGLNDTARPNDPDGADDIRQYAASNQCSGGTQPLNVAGCLSLAEGAAVNPGCVEYVGCAAPTLFCNHDDPNYLDNGNPTNHGWPCFANRQIFEFFESVRG